MVQVTLFFPTEEKNEQGPVMEKQTFAQGFISGRMFRRTMEMKKVLAVGVDETALDNLVDYVVELFGHQFTRDQFYDGIAAGEMMDTVVGCINSVVGGASKAIGSESTESPN